jgi:hypothetical protein
VAIRILFLGFKPNEEAAAARTAGSKGFMRVNNPARTRTMAASTLVKNRRDLPRRNDGVAFRQTAKWQRSGNLAA